MSKQAFQNSSCGGKVSGIVLKLWFFREFSPYPHLLTPLGRFEKRYRSIFISSRWGGEIWIKLLCVFILISVSLPVVSKPDNWDDGHSHKWRGTRSPSPSPWSSRSPSSQSSLSHHHDYRGVQGGVRNMCSDRGRLYNALLGQHLPAGDSHTQTHTQHTKKHTHTQLTFQYGAVTTQ